MSSWMLKVSLIPKEAVDREWPVLRRFLLPAMLVSNGRIAEEEILAQVKEGAVQLWAGFDDARVCYGAAVTRFQEYSAYRSLFVVLLGGLDMEVNIEPVLDTWEQLAREQGCSKLEFIGRRGWKRVLGPWGWKECSVLLERDVDGAGLHSQAAGEVGHNAEAARIPGEAVPGHHGPGGNSRQAAVPTLPR